jgi:hypothetical protein
LREIGFIVYTSGVCGYLNFLLRTIGFGFLKISDSENCRLRSFERNKNQRTIDSNYFQTLNEPAVCRKEA